MPQASTFPLHDRLVDGRLAEILGALRREGLSFDEIAIRLRDRQVRVSRSTVYRWCQDLGITASAEGAS